MTQPGTRRRATIAIWTAVTTAAALTATAAPSSADVTTVHIPGVVDGGSTYPADVNDEGVVVGTSYSADLQGSRAFVWDGTGSTALPLMDGYESTGASALND